MTTDQIDAPLLKRFFKSRYGIPVRVNSSKSKADFVECWQPSRRSELHNLVYDHPPFDAALGNRCLRLIYGEGKGGEGTSISLPAGDVRNYAICLRRAHWAALLTELGYSED